MNVDDAYEILKNEISRKLGALRQLEADYLALKAEHEQFKLAQ